MDGAARRNVLVLLSVERYKDRERIEPDAVNRLFRRVDDEVRSALRPFGYYDPKISASLTPEDKEHDWRVHIRVDVGPPVLIDTVDVSVHGPGAEDETFTRIIAAPGMRHGERLEHAAYEQLKGNLQRAAATYGYLDARMVHSELAVDTLQRRANIHLELDTGERYRFGATTIQQEAIRAARVRRYLRYEEGEFYDASKLLRTQFALDDSQYFSTVEVLPGERDSEHHTVPVTITTVPARSTYSLGAGYGTDTGVRGTFSWLDPRVNNSGAPSAGAAAGVARSGRPSTCATTYRSATRRWRSCPSTSRASSRRSVTASTSSRTRSSRASRRCAAAGSA